MSGFKDHFSSHAACYAEFRPTYPTSLFAWLAAQCMEHELAWDCATGSGQAAVGLAPHFKHVIATDASTQQIASAIPHPGVEYRVAAGETSGISSRSIDLISVAQAVHWFDLDRFYVEAKRVLKPRGVIALWGYGMLILPGSPNDLLSHFYANTLGPYWPPERALIENGYQGLAFPFDEIEVPGFEIEIRWNLPRLISYLSTWSAVRRYIDANKQDPLVTLEAEMAACWQDTKAKRCPPETAIRLRWPLFFRVGRY